MYTAITRRPLGKLTTILLAVLMTIGIGACGQEASQQPDEATSGARMKHKYGETELPSNPKRVVTLGLNDQQAALALGIKPVGVVDWFGERPYGKWPWTRKLWGEQKPKIVGERDTYKIEKIATLDPDLIIAQYSGMSKDQYEKLSKIAPTVAQPPDHQDYAAPWRLMTRRIGKALGREDRAKKLIDDVDTRFAEVRRNHPEWAKHTAVVADSFTPGEYALFAEHDAKTEFMTDLGFDGSERITKLAGDNNAAEVSSERLDLLDNADRMLWIVADDSVKKRVKADPVYQRSEVAKQERSVFVTYYDPPIGAAVSFNTVLSIPYAIDHLVPMLEKNDATANG